VAHLAGPPVDTFAHAGPLTSFVEALDTVAMSVAFEAIHIGIEGTTAVRTI